MLNPFRTELARIIRSTYRCFHCSSIASLPARNWRLSHGLPPRGTEYGPLTDLPDYSYTDGRPVPMGSRKRRRTEEQAEICRRIVSLNAELDVTKEARQKDVSEHAKELRVAQKKSYKEKGAVGVEE